MKQLGNLAIVCAQRDDIRLRIQHQRVNILIGTGYPKAALSVSWDDDAAITEIIREINFGKYKVNARKDDKAV